MKIAFWSNARERCNITSNMAAICIASVTRYPYTVITLENRLCLNNLGKAFCGGSNVINFVNEVGTNYYDGGGIEGLLRKIYRGECNPVLFKSYLKEIIQDHLYYIPQSRSIHSEIFEYEFDHSIHPLLELVDKQADICFIDTATHENLSTKTILEEADLIVVNLCQKQTILEDFFLNYSSLLSKAVILISNYDSHTMLNSKRISALYEIPWENITVLPRNEAYDEAIASGSIKEFITRNYTSHNENPNYIFMQAIKKAAATIIKRAELLSKQKEITMCCK